MTRPRPDEESTWLRRRWLAVTGIILVKLGILAVIVVLLSEMAHSFGTAHGVVLLVLLVSAAVVGLVFKRRGKRLPLALSHRPPFISKNRGRQ
jgi:uncharacterized membrane protein YpjA